MYPITKALKPAELIKFYHGTNQRFSVLLSRDRDRDQTNETFSAAND